MAYSSYDTYETPKRSSRWWQDDAVDPYSEPRTAQHSFGSGDYTPRTSFNTHNSNDFETPPHQQPAVLVERSVFPSSGGSRRSATPLAGARASSLPLSHTLYSSNTTSTTNNGYYSYEAPHVSRTGTATAAPLQSKYGGFDPTYTANGRTATWDPEPEPQPPRQNGSFTSARTAYSSSSASPSRGGASSYYYSGQTEEERFDDERNSFLPRERTFDGRNPSSGLLRPTAASSGDYRRIAPPPPAPTPRAQSVPSPTPVSFATTSASSYYSNAINTRRSPSMIKDPCATFLPPRPHSPPNLTVVLDLDETLVFARNGPPLVRPGTADLLRQLGVWSDVEVVLWTAGERDYAQGLIQKIDPGRVIEHCVYRHPKWWTGRPGYSKNIRALGRNISRTLLVDNTPDVFQDYPGNGILVSDFEGAVGDDPTLRIITDVIGHLRQHPQYAVTELLHECKDLVRREVPTDSGTGSVNVFTLRRDRASMEASYFRQHHNRDVRLRARTPPPGRRY